MSNESKIYWLTRLDNIQGTAIAAISLMVVFLIAYFIFTTGAWDDYEADKIKKNYGKYVTASKWLIPLLSALLVFLPTREDLIIMTVGGKTMDFMDSDTSLQKIPAKATEAMYQYIDRSLKEMK